MASRVLELVERLRTAPPEEADRLKRELASLLGASPFADEGRYEPVEEEAVGETEEPVVEDGLERVDEERYEPVEEEYLGQSVIERLFPDPEEAARLRRRRPPY
ncbi:MAG: hypothetical protein RXO32_11735 [Thermoproteus sp.]